MKLSSCRISALSDGKGLRGEKQIMDRFCLYRIKRGEKGQGKEVSLEETSQSPGYS